MAVGVHHRLDTRVRCGVGPSRDGQGAQTETARGLWSGSL